MNQGLKTVDQLIKEKLESQKNLTNLNPFYITPEEIEDLISNNKRNEEFRGIQVLSELFNLNEIEREIITMLLAFEIYPKYEKIFSYLQDDLNKKYPTIALFSYLFSEKLNQEHDIVLLFSEEFPLLKFGLVKFIDNGIESSLIHKPVKLEESVKNFILGLPSIDRDISNFVEILPPIKNPVVQNKKLEEAIISGENKFIFNLQGKNSFDKQKYALNLSSLNNYGLFLVDPLFFEDTENLKKNIKNLFRDALLNGCNVYFSDFEDVLQSEKIHNILIFLKNEIQKFSWIVFFDTQKPFDFDLENFVLVEKDFKFPEKEDAFKLWKKYIDLDEETIKELSQNFHFNEYQIKQVSNKLKGKILSNGNIDKKTIYKICRRLTSKDLGSLAQKVETNFSFEDIVLPEDSLKQLKNIITHYKYHYEVFFEWGFDKKISNQSISALFTGSPGTGKTMAVSILGNELGLDVYRIDLSKVVSKYIGETEKNLSKIFDSAENSGVILFFDEADAVFGKRTEIKDSHDRYANIEISYLLQRIEDYKGIVILATNFRKNIDEAFSRRIRFIINFPMPDENMRYQIWKKSFPEESPLSENVDFKLLAKEFKFSGANIKNAALHSAFYAVENNSQIKLEHIIEGIKNELQKTGKNVGNIKKQIIEEEEYEDFV